MSIEASNPLRAVRAPLVWLACSAVSACGQSSTLSEAEALARAELRPCDIYSADHAPCVAAFSSTRALYAAYDGPLYRVQRRSDGAALDIRLLAPGGYADAHAQDAFCLNTRCVVTTIYDQTDNHNDLKPQGTTTAIYSNADSAPAGSGRSSAGHRWRTAGIRPAVRERFPARHSLHHRGGLHRQSGTRLQQRQPARARPCRQRAARKHVRGLRWPPYR